MPTCSPVPTPGDATPAALGPAALSSARAVYLQQKRSFAARRGAEVLGGVAVPRITRADALELVAAWSSAIPALVARSDAGASDLEVAEWARAALAVRAFAGASKGELYPDRLGLWRVLGKIAAAMDRRNVAAPRWTDASDDARRVGEVVGELVERASAAVADVKGGAAHAAQAIVLVSDAVAGGAEKVSAAAGRGAGEGAIRGALSAAAAPAAVAGVALVSGLLLWAASRNDNRAPSESTPKKTRTRRRR